MSSELYDPIRTMSKITREVIVSFSTGKESCVVMDLCARFFDRIVPFFMYQCPGMSFQEKSLNWYEKKYGVEIIRIPSFNMSPMMRYGVFRSPDFDVPIISVTDIYDYIRGKTGVYWVCGGERIADSTIRRAMIKSTGSIAVKSGKFYPVAYWKKRDILDYMRVKKLYLGEDSRVFGTSYHGWTAETLSTLKERWPDDFEKIKRLYPLVEAVVKRKALYGGQQVPKL